MTRNSIAILTLTAILSAILLTPETAMCQTPEKEGELMRYTISGKDTVLFDIIPAVYVRQPKKKGAYWRKYYRDVHNFGKIYPYALAAKEIILSADSTILNDKLKGIKRERYLRDIQNRLFEQFEEPIKNLTVSQGKMLMKLIDREVGISSFNIIKEYRGGITAGFWQGVAKIFGSDLKKPYDKDGEDARLEELVKIWEAGQYEDLYYSLFWKYPDFIPKVSAKTR